VEDFRLVRVLNNNSNIGSKLQSLFVLIKRNLLQVLSALLQQSGRSAAMASLLESSECG
jgi:hypothetical protein